jgi:thioredoxin reductase
LQRLPANAADVELLNGWVIELSGLFAAIRTQPSSSVPNQLACTFEDGLFGPVVLTDIFKETTVPGVFVCGFRVASP